MSDTSSGNGFGDLLGLLGGANPLAGIGKSMDQFRRGVTDFLESVENFNGTMREMNAVAKRVNRLLDDVEEPVRTFMPQLTRTLKAADAMVSQLSGPVERVAPGLNRLADTLASPALTSLPVDLDDFLGVLRDLANRLAPLTQMAESAGAMFGLRPLNLLGRDRRPEAVEVSPPPAPPAPAVKKAALTPNPSTKKATAKKAPAKKAPAKKAAVKKAPAKKRSS